MEPNTQTYGGCGTSRSHRRTSDASKSQARQIHDDVSCRMTVHASTALEAIGNQEASDASTDTMKPSMDETALMPAEALRWLDAGSTIELLYIHVPFAADLDGPTSHQPYAITMNVIARALEEFLDDLGGPTGYHPWLADDFVAWIADGPERARRAAQHNLEGLEIAMSIVLRDALSRAGLPPDMHPRAAEVTIASARVEPLGSPFRSYARAIRRAQRGACDPMARELAHHSELLERALSSRAFTFHYQPIVDMNERRVIAYEALCRGTMESLRFPDVIFSLAERCARIWDLGRVLRDMMAVSLDEFGAVNVGSPPIVYLNVHPKDLDDPVFLEQALSGPLSRHANRIVVELTERAAIRDYRRVKDFFAALRRHGYRLAIDDLGSGYAGLTSLAELEPEFIKFDMSLVRDLHLHPVKRRLLHRMNEFAREIGAATISEGVECAAERDALLDVGCTLMQGYFFARPVPGLVPVSDACFPAAAAAAE